VSLLNEPKSLTALWSWRMIYSWGVPLAFCRPIVRLGIVALAALSLSACGRNGGLEMPPGPLLSAPPGLTFSEPPPGPVLSGPPPGPVASGGSDAPLTSQEAVARTGFDVHGNPAATPGQKKPFFLDPLLF
jgi:predicted small lipoprotein YifL